MSKGIRLYQRARRSLPHVLLELCLLTIGILLALGINEWRQELHKESRAELALENIRAEIHENRAAVAAARNYHLQLADTLEVLASGATAPSNSLYPDGWFAPAFVFATAWNQAQATGALEPVPYNDILTLSLVYDYQNLYTRHVDYIVQSFYDRGMNEGLQAVEANWRILIPLIRDLANRERWLLEHYGEGLKKLDG